MDESSEAPDIAELFARDPLKLTKSDRAHIIAKFRADRERYMLGLKTPKEKSAAKPKSTGTKVTGLSLGDLDI